MSDSDSGSSLSSDGGAGEFAELESEKVSEPKVVDKYVAAGQIANAALRAVLAQARVPGAKIYDLCCLGDAVARRALQDVYVKKELNEDTGKMEEVKKDLAFPTCVSINDVAGHFSPPEAQGFESAFVRGGDVVKVDLGVSIGGYNAVVGETVVAMNLREVEQTTVSDDGGAPADDERDAKLRDGPVAAELLSPFNNSTNPIKGDAAQVIAAAHTAGEAVHRMVKPGMKNTDITAMIQKIADVYGVQPVEGVLSHKMQRHIVDGHDVISNKAIPDKPVNEFEIMANEVYGIDIVMSSGEGKVREIGEERSMIYKRMSENKLQLKRKSSRQVLAQINKQFVANPFALRSLMAPAKTAAAADAAAASDGKAEQAGLKDLAEAAPGDERVQALARGLMEASTVRSGIVEIARGSLVAPYPVLREKAGVVVAQVKFTVLVLTSQTMRITGSVVPFRDAKLNVTPDLPGTLDAVVAEGDPKSVGEIRQVLEMGTRRTKKSKKKAKAKKKAAPKAAATAEKK